MRDNKGPVLGYGQTPFVGHEFLLANAFFLAGGGLKVRRSSHFGESILMATHILDPETMTDGAGAKHKALLSWVEEVAQLCKPDRVHWCDGSDDESQAMTRLMILPGTAIPLNEEKRPNSILVRSSPADVAPLQKGPFLFAPHQEEGGPT